MAIQEIIAEINKLPFDQRLELLERLAHSLRDEWEPKPARMASVGEVRGMLKSDAPAPTGEELKSAYTDYLLEKYQ
ncbi:MAG: hypothetical protein KF868_00180 [Acidobacteria bacterium]|nr:hypothetical protein [Acidobacteriota bacterium]MCW5969466.1 hypothetical protein [Blastocatellales bacterium]